VERLRDGGSVEFAKPLLAKYVSDGRRFSTPRRHRAEGILVPLALCRGCHDSRGGNELAFLVTGMHGKPVPSRTAPLRLALPGGNTVSNRSSRSSTSRSPRSGRYPFGKPCRGSEYGFWANVNPEVPHPRWSQATERVLGGNERVPTLKWNGYGEFVPIFMTGLRKERLFV